MIDDQDADAIGGQLRRHSRLVVEVFHFQRDDASALPDGDRIGPKPERNALLIPFFNHRINEGGAPAKAVVAKVHGKDDLRAVGRLAHGAQVVNAAAGLRLEWVLRGEHRLGQHQTSAQ